MSWEFDDFVLPGLITIVVLLLALAVYGAYLDDQHWQKWSVEHHCQSKGIRRGQVVTGVGPATNGKGGVAVTTGVEPDQTIYVCDGGEMVIR